MFVVPSHLLSCCCCRSIARLSNYIKDKTAESENIMIQSLVLSLLVFLINASSIAASFSASTWQWKNLVGSIFPTSSTNVAVDTSASRRRVELKRRLAEECRRSIGRNTPEIRGRVESIISELAPLNPTCETARSPLLRRRWDLEWTSEREINFFLERGIGRGITQNLEGDRLENYIPFVKWGAGLE